MPGPESLIYKLHPALIALHPFLLTLANNLADASFSQTLLPLAAVTIFCIIFSAGAYLIYKKCAGRAAAVTSIFIFMFFSYGRLEDALFNICGNINDKILLFSSIIIFLIIALKIKDAKNKTIENLNVIISAFAAVLFLFPAFEIAADKYFKQTNAKNLDGIFIESVPYFNKIDDNKYEKPDIFHIFLDEYGRSDILNEIYKLNNSEFITYLEQKGFFVADKSRCNYCYTDLSLLSTFNMDYLDTMSAVLNLKDSSERSNDAKKLLWHNAAFKFAKKAGYKIITFNTGELYTSITNSDIHYSPFSGDYYNSFYINLLINLTPLPVMLSAIGADPYLLYDAAESHRKIILYPFNKIEEILSAGDGPVFACMWIDSPHPPFVFDENGNPVTVYKKGAAAIDRWAIESEEDRIDYINNYRRQLAFISKKTARLIDTIITKSKRPPVIILQSDHGPASRFEFEKMPSDPITFRERFAILNAYYFGGRDHKLIKGLHKAITPVNTFRIVFNEYFKTEFEILADKCFHSTWLLPYNFTDITSRIIQ